MNPPGALAIAGVEAAAVHAPRDAIELGETLARAAREQRCVALVGGGTKLALGRAPERLDAVIRTRQMNRILEYAPADLVLIAEAGATLAELRAVTREHRQQLALDPPFAVGGIIATNDSGPGRARYGAVKDLIIGATLVRADGVLARSGGKVVKNVAGFDLPKLVCGSLGTLAAIATASFRLHPLPESEATVLVAPLEASSLHPLLQQVREAQLEPVRAVAFRSGAAWELALSFEGFEAGVREQCTRLSQLAAAQRLGDESTAQLWSRHARVREQGVYRLKLTLPPSRFAALEPRLAPLGGEWVYYATLGLAHLSCASIEPGAIDEARAALSSCGGSLVVQAMPDSARARIDPWGPLPAAFTVMQQLKQSFDPERRLNRGRFVGGL